MTFKSKIEASAKKANSRIVLALDLFSDDRKSLLEKTVKILETTSPYLCAVKVNHQLVLPLGLFNGVKELVSRIGDLGLPAIMDCKINDIGYTNLSIAKNYFDAGFNAVIANPFIGWEEGLQPVFEIAKKMNRGIIVLVYMSHKAAWEGYGQTVYDTTTKQNRPQYIIFAEKALSWGADGAVVGATYPEKIREVHKILGNFVPIYSPGVGVQGGDVKTTVEAGTRYLIVGRSITHAAEPDKAAKAIRDAQRNLFTSK